MLTGTGLTPLAWFFTAIAFAAFVFEAFAFVDAIRRPAAAFVAVGKQTKPIWMMILGVATVVGLGSALIEGSAAAISILPVIAFVAAGIYMADVRPKVKDFRTGGGARSGPYGPW